MSPAKVLVAHSIQGHVLDIRMVPNDDEEIGQARRRARTRIKRLFPQEWDSGHPLNVSIYNGDEPEQWGFLRLMEGWEEGTPNE